MSEKIRVYIVEDDPIIAESIVLALTKEGMDVVGQSDNAGDAFFEIDELQPDLAFLDITIEGKQSGIDLGNKLAGKQQVPFIYLTSHSDNKTLEAAMSSKPAGYLLKPFRQKDLKVAVDLAMAGRETAEEENTAEHLFVKHKKQWVKLSVNDILYAKADDNYTELHTPSERYLVSQPLKKVETKLNGKHFVRTQRSYLVNVNHIQGIEDDLLIIEDHMIPVGKTYRKEVMERLTFL